MTQHDLAKRLSREARDILIGELIFGAVVLVGTVVTLVPLVMQLLHGPMMMVEATFNLALPPQPPQPPL